MADPVPMPESGPRILGFGRNPDVAAASQDDLRRAGWRATAFALTNDPDGDARLVAELAADRYDAVVFGGGINGQSPLSPRPEPEITAWFNRVLNIVYENAPTAKIVLTRGPEDTAAALERELGTGI